MPTISDRPDIPLPSMPKGWTSLGRAMLMTHTKFSKEPSLVDSTGANLSFSETLLRTMVLAQALKKQLGDAKYIGIYLPPCAPAAIVNFAITLLGKIPVNLNYTVGKDVLDACMKLAEIDVTITSEKALLKFPARPDGKLIMLEKLPAQISKKDKAIGFFLAKIAPNFVRSMFLAGLRDEKPDNIATIIFTSGSTGVPKGVVLSHYNILSNIWSVERHIGLEKDKGMLGILPFFHSFGFTVTLWATQLLGKTVALHHNPLEAKTVGKLLEQNPISLLVATPTFMANYLQRIEKHQFVNVRRVLLGAEKLPRDLADRIYAMLNIRALEGYGCTELSPVISANVDHDIPKGDGSTVDGIREGSVGRAIPGTACKTVSPETFEDLAHGETGLLAFKGPQVMQGYLNNKKATDDAIRDGWYITGDIGRIDSDGFIFITDRLARFAKVGGEMVPLKGVEDAIRVVCDIEPNALALVKLPDKTRGEKLVVCHAPMPLEPREVVDKLNKSNMSKLWIPDSRSFVQVEEIPILGSGKTDYKTLEKIAENALG
jgi:acyl-[acyl-carrier-protein]-phospholipid O-acyltransferase/long-chain-fatty-acid--[acyl-carrier-protein] ligase